MIAPAELRRQEYVGRVNRVMDYIRENLAGDLRLETLARVARFSPCHFHRVFKSIAGETLNDYIRRQRVQKAASHVAHNPKMSMTQIAAACGYSSPSAFAREFRRAFGTTPSRARVEGPAAFERLRATGDVPPSSRRPGDERPFVFTVEVRELPARRVAYVRHVGRYDQIRRAFDRLMRWAGPRGLLGSPEALVLAVYHDNPDVTPASRLRADACVTVPEGTRADGEIGVTAIPGGTFAVARVEIDPSQYAAAWERLLGVWMPQSGYQPDDRLCYEIYRNDPKSDPAGRHIVDICEPVRPL